jgi:hypothetical protein
VTVTNPTDGLIVVPIKLVASVCMYVHVLPPSFDTNLNLEYICLVKLILNKINFKLRTI